MAKEKPIKLKDIVKTNNLTSLMDDYWERVNDTRSEKQIHPSSIASLCIKEYFYILNGDVPRNNPDSNMKKLLRRSTLVHEEIQRIWTEMGILWGDWLCHSCKKTFSGLSVKACPDCWSPYMEYQEVPLVKEEWNMVGRADGILFISGENRLGEIKSINPYDFNRTSAPQKAHITQVHCYMEMAEEYGVKDCWIHYNERNNGRYKNFLIEKDPEIIQMLDYNIKTLNECLEKGEPPDIHYNEGLDYCNKRCGSKEICINGGG